MQIRRGLRNNGAARVRGEAIGLGTADNSSVMRQIGLRKDPSCLYPAQGTRFWV